MSKRNRKSAITEARDNDHHFSPTRHTRRFSLARDGENRGAARSIGRSVPQNASRATSKTAHRRSKVRR